MSEDIVFKGKLVFESPELLKKATDLLSGIVLLDHNNFIITGTTVTITHEASGPLDPFDDAVCQLEEVAESASGGSINCWFDGDGHLVSATKALGFVSDFEALFRAVIAEDHSGIESGRSDYREEFGADVLVAYHTLTTWSQKSALLDLVQDTIDPNLNPIMVDFLRAPPEPTHDGIWMAKAIAFSFLAENRNLCWELYDLGSEVVEAKAIVYLKENAKFS